MRNNFNNIEERLQDFQTFEHEVTDDVWSNLEGDLLLNNSIASLVDLEFPIDNTIWNGIENRLTVVRPKPVIWWLPGIVAALLLFSLGIYNLDLINAKNSNNSELVNIDSANYLENVFENEELNSAGSLQSSKNNQEEKFENTLVDQIDKEESLMSSSSEIENNLMVNTPSQNVVDLIHVDDKLSTSKTGLLALGLIRNNEVLKSKNIETKINSNNTVRNQKLDEELNGNVQSIIQTGLVAETNGLVDNDIAVKSIITTNSNEENKVKSVEELIESKNPSVLLSESDIKNGVDQVVVVENETLNNSMKSILNSDEENELELEPKIEEEEKNDIIEKIIGPEVVIEESKCNGWKLIGLVGIGNIHSIESTYEVVEPTVKKALPGGNKNTQNNVPSVEEQINEGKVGLNYIHYAIPKAITGQVEKSLNCKLSIRSGLSYTRLNTKFQIYNEEHQLRLNYLSIPLSVLYSIKVTKKVDIKAILGVRVEKLISTNYKENKDYGLTQAVYVVENKGLNTTANLGLELDYKIFKNTSFISNVKANKFLQNDSQIEYRREKQSIWPEINIGFSQNL